MKSIYFFLKRAGALLYLLNVGGLSQSALAQSVNLETIRNAKPLVVSGGLGANTVFTAGLPGNYPQLNYFLSGNLNLNFLGTINVPLTFNYSNRRVELSQGYSFNQFSLNPTYKWITAHIGTNYMTFSPYTLNGHQFVGTGVELTPGKWNVQAMAGRLVKGQYGDTTTTGPTFRRMGYGLKVAYNPGKYLIGVTVFKAHEDPTTIPTTQRSFRGQVINPEDNLVVSINAGTTLFHALQLNVEYANSVLTKDRSDIYERVPIRSLAGAFVRGNATTTSFNALKMSANYNISKTQTIVSLGYERIDPDYVTLGGYYFINDLANYTLNLSQNLMGGKLQMSGNVGVQEDDIKRRKINRQRRFVGSLAANATLKEGFTMGLTYSNFQSYRFLNDTYSRLVRVPGQIVDTLAYALVSQTVGYSANKLLRQSDTRTDNLSLVATYVGSHSALAEMMDPSSQTRIVNTALTYSMGFPTRKTAVNASVSYFRNALPTGVVQGIGPTVGLQKTFGKAFNTSFNLAALNVSNSLIGPIPGAGLDQKSNSLALNAQLLANMRIGQHHAFNFLTGVVSNNANTYVNGNVGYNFSF